MKLIELLSEDKTYGVSDTGWSREQVMCALQIEAELTALGCDKEFIAGFIGNVKNEGRFGILEGVNRDGKYRGKDILYWIHMMQCVDYYDIYNKKELTDVNLIQLYVDLIYKRENGECTDKDNHKIGIGMVQWTEQARSDKLMSFYLDQVGYDMNSTQFNEYIQAWQRSKSKEEVYLTEEQIRNAEINMMIYELTSEDKDNIFKDFYKNYSENRSNDNQEALNDITYTIYKDYECPATDSYDLRLAAAKRWYEISSE